MTPASISQRVVIDRLAIIEQALIDIQDLPLESLAIFLADKRNVWTAESCLRRALEALMDIGRHILAKGFARGVTEYKEIVVNLHQYKILDKIEASQMRKMTGYRNRLVHFYDEITPAELYTICTTHLQDVQMIRDAYRRWLGQNSHKLDQAL